MAGIDDIIKIFGEIGFKVDTTAFDLTKKQIDKIEGKIAKLRKGIIVKKESMAPLNDSIKTVKENIAKTTKKIGKLKLDIRAAMAGLRQSPGNMQSSSFGQEATRKGGTLKRKQDELLRYKRELALLGAEKTGISDSIKGDNTEISKLKENLKGLSQQNTQSVGEIKAKWDEFQMSARDSAVDELTKQTGLSVEQLNRAFKTLGWSLNKDNKVVNAFGKEIELMGKKTKESAKNLALLKKASVRLNMGLLSVMFAAMNANRVFMQMLRGLTTTYQKANDDTGGLGKSTWHLIAAWEFFKYSLIDALLSSGFFKTLLDWALKLVNWFNELDEGEKAFMAISLAVGAVVTGVISLVAQIGLAATGFKALGWGGSTKVLGDLDKANSSLGALGELAKLGIGIWVFWEGLKLIKKGVDDDNLLEEILGIIATSIGGWVVGGVIAKATGAGAAAGGLPGAAVGFTLGVIAYLEFKFQISKDIKEGMKREWEGIKLLKNQIFGRREKEDDIIIDFNTGLMGTRKEIEGATAAAKLADDQLTLMGESSRELNKNLNDTVAITPNVTSGVDKQTESMWNLSESVSAVNQGNSPTGLIHIIASEEEIIDLQPTFTLSIQQMIAVMDMLSDSISNQQGKLTSLIAELDRYIKKLQEAAAAEAKTKSGGIMSSIKGVLGYKATGGYIGQTGPYMLHEGEFVVPRGSPGNKYSEGEETYNSYNISLNLTTTSSDPDELSRIVLDRLTEELNRLTDSNNT